MMIVYIPRNVAVVWADGARLCRALNPPVRGTGSVEGCLDLHCGWSAVRQGLDHRPTCMPVSSARAGAVGTWGRGKIVQSSPKPGQGVLSREGSKKKLVAFAVGFGVWERGVSEIEGGRYSISVYVVGGGGVGWLWNLPDRYQGSQVENSAMEMR